MQRQLSAPRAPRQDLKILNGVRGGAALYVMLFHAVWLLSAPASFGLLIAGVLSYLAVAGLIAPRLEHVGQ